MLSFATEFPVASGLSRADFLAAVRKWLLGSPHTVLIASDLAPMDAVEGEWRTAPGPEQVEVLTVAAPGQEGAGVRYARIDDALEWATTIVFRQLGHAAWVSIRVGCESSHPTSWMPIAKKPVVVKTLMQLLGGGRDGLLSLLHTPHYLRDDDIPIAAALISGDSRCRLPVVYVSAAFDGRYAVSPAALARDLSGMAHVVVEPNRPFSARLRIDVQSANVYGGSVGIYWPDGAGRRAFFVGSELRSAVELQQAVVNEVRLALVNRRPLEQCGWASLQQHASRATTARLQAQGSQQVSDYVASFEKEIQAMREDLATAEREIARLTSEVRRLEARSKGAAGMSLATGSEQDLYPSEIRDIVLDALSDARTRVTSDSRREHVIAAVVEANPTTAAAETIRERLKELLRGYTSLDKRTRRGLEELGFSITDDGKHHKLVLQGDDRYTIALAKTGSDHRGGLNSAADIARLCF